MAVSVRHYSFAEVTGLTKGINQEIGDKSAFGTFVPTNGEVQVFSATIADAGTQVIMWIANDGAMATFEQMFLISDKDLTIELSDAAESFTLDIKANMMFSIGGTMFADQAASAVDTMGNIDKITVKRNVADGVGDAFIQMLLVG